MTQSSLAIRVFQEWISVTGWKQGRTPPDEDGTTRPRQSGDLLALEAGWGIRQAALRYLPLGFGSHHWETTSDDGGRWYVTVDDLLSSHLGRSREDSLATLESAFRTTVALRDDARLPFVVGPIASIDGQVLRRLGQRYAVSVFPYLDVEPGDSGEFRTDRDRDEAMRMFGRVHNATGSVPVDALRQNTLVIQDRDRLLEALNAIEEPWTGGPYAEPARDLLRAHAREVRAVLGRFDALSGSVMGDDSDWVITHGEPHAANVVRSSTGDLVVVDWDTVAFAPRERDLWMLVDDAHGDWSAYRDVSGVTALSGEAMWAYRMHWSLSEIAVFTGWCRDRHERTGDMEVAWTKLQQYVKDIL